MLFPMSAVRACCRVELEIVGYVVMFMFTAPLQLERHGEEC